MAEGDMKIWPLLLGAGIILFVVYLFMRRDCKSRQGVMWLSLILIFIGLFWWMIDHHSDKVPKKIVDQLLRRN